MYYRYSWGLEHLPLPGVYLGGRKFTGVLGAGIEEITELTEVSSTGIERYELTDASGTGIAVVPEKYRYPQYRGRAHSGVRGIFGWGFHSYLGVGLVTNSGRHSRYLILLCSNGSGQRNSIPSWY